jgi:hypothetical protein
MPHAARDVKHTNDASLASERETVGACPDPLWRQRGLLALTCPADSKTPMHEPCRAVDHLVAVSKPDRQTTESMMLTNVDEADKVGIDEAGVFAELLAGDVAVVAHGRSDVSA